MGINNPISAPVPPQQGYRREDEEEESGGEDEEDEEDEEAGGERGKKQKHDEKLEMDWDDRGACNFKANRRKFSSFMGKIARQLPINFDNWRNFEKENKQLALRIWKHVLVRIW